MMKKGSIGFNTLVYSGGSIVVKILSFFSIFILTYLLEPMEYGVIATFQSLLPVCSILFSMNIGLSIIRKFYEKEDDFLLFYNYSIRLFFKIFSFVGGLYIIVVLLDFFTLPALMLICLIPICYFQFFIGIYKSLHVAKANSIGSITIDLSLKILVLLLPIIGIIMLENNKFGWLIGFLFSYVIVGLYCIRKSDINLKINEVAQKDKYYNYIKNFSFPLVMYSLSSVVLDFFDRIMIGEMLGYEDAGLYSFAYNIGFVVLVLRQAILDAQRPFYYEYMASHNFKLADELSYKALSRVLVIVALICLFYVEIGSILAGSDSYKSSFIIIPIISVSYLSHSFYQILSRQLMFAKRTKWISISVYIAGIINIGLNFYFLPIYGFKFGAISTLISYTILPFLLLIVLRYIEKSTHIPPLSRISKESFLVLVCVFSSIYFLGQIELYWLLDVLLKILLALLVIVYLKPVNFSELLQKFYK